MAGVRMLLVLLVVAVAAPHLVSSSSYGGCYPRPNCALVHCPHVKCPYGSYIPFCQCCHVCRQRGYYDG